MVESRPNNAPPETAPLETASPAREREATRDPVSRGIFSAAKQIGHNIDLVTFQGRVKDLYKLGDTVGVGVSLFLRRFRKNYEVQQADLSDVVKTAAEKLHNAPDSETRSLTADAFGKMAEAIKKNNLAEDRRKGSILVGNRVSDAANFLVQWFIAKTSNSVEQDKLSKVYDKALQQELGIASVTKDDYKRSQNPIIRNSAEYYSRKGKYRMIPVWMGLVHVIPAVARLLGENSKAYQNTKWMEEFSGSDASLGGMAAYYAWYFSKRQKGAFYQLDDLWDQTEGITTQENRSINRGVNPGTLVTSEKITKLYDEVAKEQSLPEFKVTDPLTNRIFDQIARYLNHQYQPLLYRVKVPNPKLHEELEGSHFTHADLVTLFGSKGIDINDAYATAVRMETLARTGIAHYREVDARIQQIERPHKERYADDTAFAQALETYLGQLDHIARDAMGPAWPTPYIENEIRPEIPKSYNIEPKLLPVEMRLAGPNKAAPVRTGMREVAQQVLATIIPETPGTQADHLQPRDFRARVTPQANRALSPQPETHGERAEASQGTAVLAI